MYQHCLSYCCYCSINWYISTSSGISLSSLSAFRCVCVCILRSVHSVTCPEASALLSCWWCRCHNRSRGGPVGVIKKGCVASALFRFTLTEPGGQASWSRATLIGQLSNAKSCGLFLERDREREREISNIYNCNVLVCVWSVSMSSAVGARWSVDSMCSRWCRTAVTCHWESCPI